MNIVRSSTTLSSGRQGKQRRMAGLVAGLLALLSAMPAAKADPMACVTAYYVLGNGEPQYIHDDCHMPSAWGKKQGGGPDCAIENSTVKVCYEWSVAYPVP